ncbi:MAG TPA: FHA domain-containing protein [Polyangiaceae bacterium]|nr:FHA domain-containing protein [Polyangiaceae bacterium]
MSRYPRATPSAPIPKASVPPADRRLSAVLVAPVVVVAPDVERELISGSLRIGRHPSSDIVLEDALVSRTHARLVVQEDGSLVIEDLHSANGVYVNGERLGRHSHRLCEGDRLLIGTCELSVFSCRAAPSLAEPPSVRSAIARVLDTDAEGPPTTERTDGLQMVARLAERFHRAGNSMEAIRVLSGHLNKVLLGASAGLAVPSELLDEASRHAVELYYWTYNGAWIDYVIELHLATQALPSERTVATLEAAIASSSGTPFDAGLLKYFLESQASTKAPRTLAEEARLSRLERLRSQR